MKSKLLHDDEQKTWLLVFDPGDEVKSTLESFARAHVLSNSYFRAIGAFQRATLAYWNWDSKQYEEIPIDEQVEVLGLNGDIALGADGSPKVHAHVTVGRFDGTTRGGHLMKGVVRPTLELYLVESPGDVLRRKDETTGLELMAL